METNKVQTIIRPYHDKILLDYTVSPDDKLMYAVELMVSNGREYIAVAKDSRPVGMIRLEDAFHQLGLKLPCK